MTVKMRKLLFSLIFKLFWETIPKTGSFPPVQEILEELGNLDLFLLAEPG